jgi:hypothetical protein
LFTVRCATTEIHDTEVCVVELPYDEVTKTSPGGGYCRKVISKEERFIPREKWVKERRAGILILPDEYAKLKNKHYKDCFTFECKQSLDSVSETFIGLDKTLKLLDGVK